MGLFVSRVDALILLVLGLVGTSALLERPDGGSTGLVDLGDLPDLESRLETATELWISGPTMHDFLVRFRECLETYLSEGGSMVCLVGPREGPLLDAIVAYFDLPPADAHSHCETVEISEVLLQKWQTAGLAVTPLRLTAFPAHNLLLINPSRLAGEAQVQLNLMGEDTALAPLLRVKNSEAPEKFLQFKREFERLRAAALPLE